MHHGAKKAESHFIYASAMLLCCRAGGSQLLRAGSRSLWGRKRGAVGCELLVTGMGKIKISYPNISRQKDLKLISLS